MLLSCFLTPHFDRDLGWCFCFLHDDHSSKIPTMSSSYSLRSFWRAEHLRVFTLAPAGGKMFYSSNLHLKALILPDFSALGASYCVTIRCAGCFGLLAFLFSSTITFVSLNPSVKAWTPARLLSAHPSLPILHHCY